MLDPQFYLPHSDHTRLVAHPYWPNGYSTGSFFAGSQLTKLLADLRDLNSRLRTFEVILPGLLADQINDDWLSTQKTILVEARTVGFDVPLCQTVAISADACRSESQIAKLLEHSAENRAESYYLVCEHPKGNYLVDDAMWLANVIDVAAGLKLSGARVIIGYCNHQMLIAGTTKADAIASGTWMNVRSFPPEKFRSTYEDEIRQRAVWFYCPQALSEYRLPFLDIAQKIGKLNLMAPIPPSSRTSTLFTGGQPSTIGLSEPDAFQHYLSCLKEQVDSAVKRTFDETVSAHDLILTEAEELLNSLRASRIKGQMRDFAEIVDVNRAALAALEATRGPILRRRWSTL